MTMGDRRYAAFLCVREFTKGTEPWVTKPRTFSTKDVGLLTRSLTRHGFACQSPVDIATKQQLRDALQTVANAHEQYDTLFVFISAFGFKDNEHIYCGKSLCNVYKHITDIFGETCPDAVVDKEKVFFIQGCYPPDYSSEQADTAEGSSGSTTTARRANISMFWSRIPGDLQWHDANERGSLSVHHFCQLLETKQQPMSFGELFVKVNWRMVDDMKTHGTDVLKTPSWDSTATHAVAI